MKEQIRKLRERIEDLRYRVESFGSLGDETLLEDAERELRRLQYEGARRRQQLKLIA